MRNQDFYWNIFSQSGDPEAYMQYKRHNADHAQAGVTNTSQNRRRQPE